MRFSYQPFHFSLSFRYSPLPSTSAPDGAEVEEGIFTVFQHFILNLKFSKLIVPDGKNQNSYQLTIEFNTVK